VRNAYLIGEKVYLRPLEESDVPGFYGFLADPDVRRTLVIRATVVTESSSREYVRGAAARRDQLFAIVTRDDDVHIGNAGIHDIDAVNQRAELGLVIGRKEVWGRGYGTEAARLVCRHGFATLNLHRISLSCYAINERGLALYRRVGFREEGRRREHVFIEGRWVDEVVMGLLRGELVD